MSERKTFGPMHGERTRRHQFVGTSSRDDELIISTYEIRDRPEPRLAVEYYRPHSGVTSAWLTVEEAGWLRDALDEFIEAMRQAPKREGDSEGDSGTSGGSGLA